MDANLRLITDTEKKELLVEISNKKIMQEFEDLYLK